MLAVPELRAAMLEQLALAIEMKLLEHHILAERAGRSSEDLAVRTLSGAVVGAAMAAMFVMLDDPSRLISRRCSTRRCSGSSKVAC